MIEGLCTGAGLREGVLNLEMRRGDEKLLRPIKVGDSISFAVVSKRSCIGSRPPGAKSLLPCPHNITDISSSQCPECFEGAKILPCLRCTGERCANPARREDCVQPDNHIVYLAAFSPDLIKVGVARFDRRRERLREQGAVAGLIIARDDGQQVRRFETSIRKTGIPDRIAPTIKIGALSQKYEEKDVRELLSQALVHIKGRLRASWLEDPEYLFFDLPKVRELPPKLIAPHFEMTQRGQVEEVIGQIMIIRSDIGQTIAIEAPSLVGYNLRSLEDNEKAEGQIALLF